MAEMRADEVIVVEPWHTDVGIYYDYNKFKDFVETADIECHHANSMYAACCFMEDDGTEYHAMFIPVDCRIESLYHESLHMAWKLLEGHGVYVIRDNDELLTYFQGYIVRLLVAAVPHLGTYKKWVLADD